MIIALVGRRIDGPNAASPVFPDSSIPLVHDRIRDLLKEQNATAMVSSAACGADLIALKTAGELNLRRLVILPFAPERFRETSVVDRPGDWGSLFDQVIAEVKAKNDLVDLGLASEEDESYIVANRAIIEESLALAESTGEPIAAVLVWNGVSRGPGDVTNAFGDAARARGWKVLEISTL
jgi:hypothetical protein